MSRLSLETVLKDFSERHHLMFTDLVRREAIAIRSLSVANTLVNQGFSQLDGSALTDPAIGLLLNLLHRNFEHVDASIVAFVSGCGSSAEITARAAVEFSVNIIYILAGDRAARLIAYFNYYLDGVDRQIERWRSEIDQLTPDQAEIHNLGMKQRRAANDVLRQWVSALGVHSMERWPAQIEQRFRAIGASLDYRTFYARMSSEAHADAEETLRYFVAMVTANDSLLEAWALETVWTSRFYIYFAASLLLRASLAYSRSYKLPFVEPRLRKGLADVERELIVISSHIGADI